MKQCFGFRTNVNLYFTPKGSHAFEAHFDWMESFILQIYGSKNWTLYALGGQNEIASLDPFPLPFPSQKFKPSAEMLINPAHILLSPGDVLYVPSGLIHEASTQDLDEESLHLTFGVEIDPAYTWTGLIFLCTKHLERHYQPSWAQSHEFVNFLVLDAALVKSNSFLRRAVPYGIWSNSPKEPRLKFHQEFLQILSRLMDVVSYKRSKRRLLGKDEDRSVLFTHFHESIKVYFSNIMHALSDESSDRDLRLGKKDLFDLPGYMSDYGLFESVMQEFVSGVKSSNAHYILSDRHSSELNYFRLSEHLMSMKRNVNEKDEL
jgi:hypothetical protein